VQGVAAEGERGAGGNRCDGGGEGCLLVDHGSVLMGVTADGGDGPREPDRVCGFRVAGSAGPSAAGDLACHLRHERRLPRLAAHSPLRPAQPAGNHSPLRFPPSRSIGRRAG
jgi:hypothetical protein